MAISSPGIGSNLNVNDIVTKLMQVEAQPLTTLATKEAGYQAKLSAYGSLSGSLASFQTAMAGLSSQSKFQGVNAASSDSSVLTASSTSQAVPGSYNVNVTQLAHAQTIATAGQASATGSIGSGGVTTLSFDFGSISGGSFAKAGVNLGAAVASGGIAANSLSINGTVITTSSATNSAKNLAAQINLSTSTTGVTATAAATDTGVLAFTAVTTDVGDAYTLQVGGTTLASIGASSSLSAADLDTAISSGAGALGLASEGITVSGTAVGGDLKFTRADGSNVNITQTLNNSSTLASGGIAGLSSGVAKTYTSSVSLASNSAISVSGSNPSLAGLTPGNGIYVGASYTQDANQTSGTVTIDNTNNSLQGMRDAINKANIGVTASIVSDGSATPYHLILTSNKTGATSSMKITVSGEADIGSLLGYDPGDVQNMTESTAAQNTLLTVNGISVSSATSSVSEAIQGTSLSALKIGASSVTISRDTASVTSAINQFVKAYNDLDSSIKSLTSYDPTTKVGGPLLGDAAARNIQASVRKMLSTPIDGIGGSITNLSQIGVGFQKDGTLAVDSAKLQTAVNNNFGDVAGLFAALGTTTDSLVTYTSSSSATKSGSSTLNITALATRGSVTGSAAPSTLTITAGLNDQINMTIDGLSATATLAPGTYTSASLATQVQSAINGATGLASSGIAVSVTADSGGVLTITSNKYGSASNVNIGGSAAANLIGSAPTTITGIDIAGTINGQPATGSGQTLIGSAGSIAEGLQLKVTGGALGPRGTVNFSRGYGYQLNALADTFIGTNGLLKGQTDGINSTIKDIGTQRDAFNVKLAAIEKRYRAQYTALDVTISQMTQTQNYLTQQLASLASVATK